MILTTILLGAALIAGTGLVAKFWNNIVSWLKRAVDKVKRMIKVAVYGTKVFIKKMREGYEELSRHFSKNANGRWQETVVTKVVSESEVPPEIRAMAPKIGIEADITNQLELQLN